MSSLALLSVAALVPIVLALPVPQAIGTGLTNSYGWPVGSATLGGLNSGITLEDGSSSYAGPPKPPAYGWGGNNNGYGWQNDGDRPGSYGHPRNNDGYGSPYNNDRPAGSWYGYPRGGETSTSVTVSGPGGITSSSSSYNKRNSATLSEPIPGGRFGGYTKGRDGQPRPGITTGPTSGPLTGLSHPAPKVSQGMGGLTSSITLGGKVKRQVATDLGTDGTAALSGLQSGLTLEGGNEAESAGTSKGEGEGEDEDEDEDDDEDEGESEGSYGSNKAKRQIATNLEGDGLAIWSEPESNLVLEGEQ